MKKEMKDIAVKVMFSWPEFKNLQEQCDAQEIPKSTLLRKLGNEWANDKPAPSKNKCPCHAHPMPMRPPRSNMRARSMRRNV